MVRFLSIILGFLFIASSAAQEADGTARWLRFPAISPDGKNIVFGYMGNLYKVSSEGGTAVALTVGEAYSQRPVWSHDGKLIAYSSDLYGNFDVFIIPSEGGKAKRLTYHSADDYAYDFTPDNKNVLTGSHRDAISQSVRFPSTRFFQNLYITPVNGTRPVLLTSAGAESARYNSAGTKIIFQDKKGYEDEYRKHQTSSIARDIWVFDIKQNQFTQVTDFKGEDRNPHFSQDGKHFFYTSEENGDLNVFKKSLLSQTSEQITHFKNFPVRSLSVSKEDKMAFEWKGDIYVMEEGSKPQKLEIKVLNNAGYNHVKNITGGKVSEFAVSPDGKEIAYVIRGEIFVTGIEHNITKRITGTPQQERMISWSPDGKALLYAGEQDSSWNIYKTTLKNPEEKFFYAATLFETETVSATKAEEFRAKFSPDGKKIAFIEERNILKVLDIESGDKITVLPEGHNYSYSDGDWDFEWSPDSKWLLADDGKGYFANTNAALISLSGSDSIIYPVNSGFGEDNAKWGMEGKIITYESSKLGRKSLAYQGSRETDVYAVFFDPKAYDEYVLSKEEYGLLKAKQEDDKEEKKDEDKEDKKSKKKGDKKDEKEKDETLNLNFNGLNERIVRLTINSASISDYALTKDGSKLYYLAAFEKGYDLWVTEPRTRDTKILTKLNGSSSKITLSKDEKFIFLNNNGALVKIEVSNGKKENISIKAEMELNTNAERQYIYEHAWRQVLKKFYDPEIHGIDWEMYRDVYAEFLLHINNNYDFQVLLSEILGELNASHTGGRYYPSPKNAVQTASLGVLFDETYIDEGIKISEVLSGGPLDKSDRKIRADAVILKINGIEIKAEDNWNQYLNNLSGNTLLTVEQDGAIFDYTMQPVSIGQHNELMYKRWITNMERMTDSLSGGKLGYVHVRGMNDNSFREVYEIVMGKNVNKKALVVDTRFNGGGWLHNDLNTFLSGKEYLKFAPQGNRTKGGEPLDRWTKPSIVVMSEGNYSDAFIFPYIYKQNGIGKLVGMPVPGTGTAVWWERQIDPTIVFGIPMVATIGDEDRPTENLELQPDILVPLPYNDFLNGKDTQLERAVKELLKEVE